MLDRRRNRRPIGRIGWIGLTLLALMAAVPIAMTTLAADAVMLPMAERVVVQATASPEVQALLPPTGDRSLALLAVFPQRSASLTGRVVDQMGWVIPGATVTLVRKNGQQATEEIAGRSDSNGAFAFRDIAAGDYEMSTRLAGFNVVSERLTLSAGAATTRVVALPIGLAAESVTVSCKSPFTTALEKLRGLFAAVASAQELPSGPLRVGGAVRYPSRIPGPLPICPSTPASPITVRLTGYINADGLIQELAIQEGQAAERAFADAALNAVRQWRYSPALLNGKPVSVQVVITVTFTAS